MLHLQTGQGGQGRAEQMAQSGRGPPSIQPGARRCCSLLGDMSSRHFKPEIRVTSLRFSPTGEPHATGGWCWEGWGEPLGFWAHGDAVHLSPVFPGTRLVTLPAGSGPCVPHG